MAAYTAKAVVEPELSGRSSGAGSVKASAELTNAESKTVGVLWPLIGE